MEFIVYEIGVLVLTSILYVIPILTACSFIYDWPSFFQFVMAICLIIEFCMLAYFVDAKVDRGE